MQHHPIHLWHSRTDAQESLIETLQILATAVDSRGRGLPFYENMLAVLQQYSQKSD